MKHREWSSEMQAALSIAIKQPEAAAARFRKLAAQSRREARTSIGSWHVEQVLGLAATSLASRGKHIAAASSYRTLARVHRGQFQYYGHALASSLASAALELFAAGQGRRAATLALEALRYFGQFPEASVAHEQLVKALRAHQAKRPSRRGRGGA